MSELDEMIEFSNINNVMVALGERNPGAYTVVSKLFEIIELDETKEEIVTNLIKNLINKNIVGARLWYVYKNEAKIDVNNLLNLNLDVFTDDYFYEKFEKYI